MSSSKDKETCPSLGPESINKDLVTLEHITVCGNGSFAGCLLAHLLHLLHHLLCVYLRLKACEDGEELIKICILMGWDCN